MSVALKKIHIGAKQLGLNDDTKRDIYLRVTGKNSAKDMSEAEREAVVDDLVKKGFKPSSNVRRDGRQKLEGVTAKKLQALWIGAWNLGLITNKDDAAMLAFVKRQTGVDHTRFLRHKSDANKAIEGLKAWMAREGGVDWSLSAKTAAYACTAGFKIALAQSCTVFSSDADKAYAALHEFVLANTGQYIACMISESNWIPVMNKLGTLVREKQAAA